jgi:hypothetical protein
LNLDFMVLYKADKRYTAKENNGLPNEAVQPIAHKVGSG